MDTASNESKRINEAAPAEVTSGPQGGGPGPLIREAREKAGLSVGELATQLRLTVATLEALEADDFQTLREAVYVRGYYRKCAKLLPLSEPELIAAYDRIAAPKSAMAAMPSKLLLASSESDGRDVRKLLRWLLAAAVVVAVVVVVGLMFSRRERASNEAAPAEAPAAVGQPPPQTNTESAAAKPAEAVAAPATPAAEPGAQPVAGTPPAAETNSHTSQAVEPAHPEPAAPAAHPEPASPAAQKAATDAGGGVAAASPAAEPASAGSAAPATEGTLVLDFRGQSWAEVFDASGKRLLSGMIRAGSRETLVGRLPYSVFLGDAPRVEVSFGGQRVDLSGRVRDNSTARFQIPLN